MAEQRGISKAQLLTCATLIFVAACTVVCVYLTRPRQQAAAAEPPAEKQEAAQERRNVPFRRAAPPAAARNARNKGPRRVLRGQRNRNERPSQFTEQEILERLASAQDTGDFPSAEEVFGQAAASANRDVRMAAVHTMAWFGLRALPRLATFLSDADPEVRRAALFLWQTALDGISDADRRERAIRNALSCVSDGEIAAMLRREFDGVVREPNRPAEGGKNE